MYVWMYILCIYVYTNEKEKKLNKIVYTAHNEMAFVETSDASQSRHKSAPPVPVENRILDRRSSGDDNLRRIRSDLFTPLQPIPIALTSGDPLVHDSHVGTAL